MESIRKSFVLGCALAVAGCGQSGAGGSSAPSVAGGMPALPSAARAAASSARPAASSNGPQIYVFQGYPTDATTPEVGLVNVGGTLYGTSYNGGANNLGAVYSVTTSGAETLMHSFAGGSDGENPDGPLTNVNGTLYGTTYQEGAAHGTIFSITPSGTYNIVYNFGTTATDCMEPDSAMVYVPKEKALYGTAYIGGADGEGCVFKLSLSGKTPVESIVYSFTGSTTSPTEASAPAYYDDALYFTTPLGGTNGDGTVLKVTLTGDESVVYSFKDQPDGANPEASLVAVGDALYGTTKVGGNGACGGFAGCGTVFKVTPSSGVEKVLHRFTDFNTKVDASAPQSPLIALGDTLYGVSEGCTGVCGAGVVFAITTSGAESIVYDFGANASSPPGYPEDPFGSLVSLNGMFYGTTAGSAHSGYGTVYAVPQ